MVAAPHLSLACSSARAWPKWNRSNTPAAGAPSSAESHILARALISVRTCGCGHGGELRPKPSPSAYTRTGRSSQLLLGPGCESSTSGCCGGGGAAALARCRPFPLLLGAFLTMLSRRVGAELPPQQRASCEAARGN